MINLCKKLIGKSKKKAIETTDRFEPMVIQRNDHPVSRQQISPNALKVLYRLNKGGYDAYLVGGGVRDMFFGITPKDFDIVTSATPEQIKDLFRNCRLIGRRFRLAHILFGREIIEVATFRGHHSDDNCQKVSKQSDQGMLLRDNIYGSIEEDAERRDFTINALYYSAIDFTIHDFAGGVADIKAQQIRLIGDPETRYREDPVRMLRAIRFATKLDMKIHPETEKPIKSLSSLLDNIPAARMFEEFNKLFLSGKAAVNYQQLREYKLFEYFFPATEYALRNNLSEYLDAFVLLALKNTDDRINNDKRVTPAFLFAAILWYPLQAAIRQINESQELSPQDAFYAGYNQVMSEQQQSIAIPKRFQLVIKDIWLLQDRLSRQDTKSVYKAFEHPKFRAGFDFLLLRGEIEGGELVELGKWWQDFQQVSPETQKQMLKHTTARLAPRRTPRKRRKPRPTKPSTDA
ncbi:MAG: polynucleotide adenylyltransferase PcnB [Thalassotalea sp.]